MPRGTPKETYDPSSWDRKTRTFTLFSVPDWVFRLKLNPVDYRGVERIPGDRRKDLEKYRLYSLSTRNYLRRRAWRYFRKLGRLHPQRYVAAVSEALVYYQDRDVADGLAMIDNWGLIHILFHFSPVLVADDRGWKIAEERSLAELEPAPMFARLWEASPRALVDVLVAARARPVRGWAIRMIRRNLAAVVAVFPLEERLALLGNDDPDTVALMADLIRDDPGLKSISLERWLALIEDAGPNALEIVCEQVERWISADRVSFSQAVRLAVSRPLPAARLGLEWLLTKSPRTEEDCQSLLGLADAGCEPIRPALVRWAREALSNSGRFRPEWVLDWMDSRHEDVRAEGWAWFQAEPSARENVVIWQRLMESPYDDVRLALVTELESRSRTGGKTMEDSDPEAESIRILWASVLLNIHRGGRAKPLVVRQLVGRIQSHPGDLPRLLPILSVALRSVRGPEWRAGLAAVVQVVEHDPSAAELVRSAFPELQWS